MDHSRHNIKSHIHKQHNLSLDQYEAKYELSNKGPEIEEEETSKVQTSSSGSKIDENKGTKLVDNSTYSHIAQISRLSSGKDPIDNKMKTSDEPNNGLVDERKVDIVEKKKSELDINGLADSKKVETGNIQLNTRKRKISHSQDDHQKPKKSSLMHEIDEMELFMERLRSKMVKTQIHKTGPGQN